MQNNKAKTTNQISLTPEIKDGFKKAEELLSCMTSNLKNPLYWELNFNIRNGSKVKLKYSPKYGYSFFLYYNNLTFIYKGTYWENIYSGLSLVEIVDGYDFQEFLDEVIKDLKNNDLSKFIVKNSYFTKGKTLI